MTRAPLAAPSARVGGVQHSMPPARPKFEKYPAKLHARKVAKLLNAEKGLIYLEGKQEELWDKSDQNIPFRQDRDFFYLSGADIPGCSLLYNISKDYLTLYIPHIPAQQELWFGKTPSAEWCLEHLDIDEVEDNSEAKKCLSKARKEPGSRYDTPMYFLNDDGTRGFRTGLPDPSHMIDLRGAIDAARVVKTSYEIAQLRRANKVTGIAHKAVLERIRGLTNESQVETIFRAACSWHGAKKQAYHPICGSGGNAATLHYPNNDEDLEGRELMLVDAAAEWGLYAADVTRTFPLNGKWSKEAKDIYDIVELMQESCISQIRPGKVYHELQITAWRIATQGLLKLGILQNGDVNDLMKHGTVAAFFPHGLGHHIGLEVHDVQGHDRLLMGQRHKVPMHRVARGSLEYDQSRDSKRQPMTPDDVAGTINVAIGGHKEGEPSRLEWKALEENMVVTVEPGIYFCRSYLEAYFKGNEKFDNDINWDLVEKYYKVGGVRIEDDILVTQDGHENITTAPKGEEALKIIRGE